MERSHRIDEQYFYWQAPTDTLVHFNTKLTLWLEYYNRFRPHGGLTYLTPWEKIFERLEALPAADVTAEYESPEQFRLMFLEQSPKMIQEQQWRRSLNIDLAARKDLQYLQRKNAA